MRTKAFFLASMLLIWGFLPILSNAQVTTDITSSGLGTAVAPISGGVVTITGGMRPGDGPNLFHSFGLFNVGAGDTANFSNNTGLPTTNILSRVTGGSPSNIFGTIKTTDFGNANLFLINPAGVVFGPTASLDIGSSVGTPGSFHASTADYVRLFDGTNSANFYVNPASDGVANSVLSSAPPVDFGFLTPQAFGFLNSSPAAITFDNSFLSVGAGQTLSAVSGDVTMTGGALNAPGGQINLVSVASPGEALLPGMQSAPNVNGDSFSSFGTINMSQGATLDVSDYGFEVDGRTGTVLIRGGQLVMDSAFMFAFTIGDTDGATTGVDIDVAGDVQLSNLSLINTDTFGLGRSGDIVINARNVDVRDFSFINTHSGSAGPAGNVTITASGAVTVTGTDGSGNFSNISSVADSGGDSGTINIQAAAITLDEAGQIRTQTSGGQAGGITLEAGGDVNVLRGGLIEIDGSGGGSSGAITITAAGTVEMSDMFDPFTPSEIKNISDTSPANISIGAGNFLLTDSARINARTSTGTNGTITIAASASASITGGSEIINATAAASGGSLQLSAPAITIDNGLLSTRANSTGNAGTLTISAGNLTVSGDSVIASTTFSSGHGGALSISASGAILLSGGSSIESRSTGTGDAGSINIAASDSLVMQNGSISTATTQSDGGDIHIQVGRLVQLTDSQITTSVQGGLGNGGNITIDPQFVILQNSQIIANAFGGNGGNILIVAGVFLADPNSTVSASSTFGLSGTVQIQTTVSNLSESVTPLSGEFVQAAELLQARCAAKIAGGSSSSFVVAGRDGLPLEPGGLLPSPLYVGSLESNQSPLALDVPRLRVGANYGESSAALTPLLIGCAS